MESTSIFAKQALLADGWRENCWIEITADGRIGNVATDRHDADHSVDILLPAGANLHSHAFQRAMAGLTERRGDNPNDDFWAWRKVMYRFVDLLGPEELKIIAAQAQMEMLEAGFASVGEFHYLHHQPGGTPYDELAASSVQLLNAAMETGIGYTHLPVLYMRGGMDGRPLTGGQLRFGNDVERFALLVGECAKALGNRPSDFNLGVAPHSLRAVTKAGLSEAAACASSGPIHIHIAEQTAEVADVRAAYGARPVEWLFENAEVDDSWCLVHATHVSPAELKTISDGKAIAGLCPITEANLGDGVFPAQSFLTSAGRFGIGSDSNVQISLTGELRLLEYSQRLTAQKRAVLAASSQSCGRVLFEETARGGAAAIGRDAGRIETGALADLISLDANNPALAGLAGDHVLDAWIFSSNDAIVGEVWAAGRHVVKDGHHIRREAISGRFTSLMNSLRSAL